MKSSRLLATLPLAIVVIVIAGLVPSTSTKTLGSSSPDEQASASGSTIISWWSWLGSFYTQPAESDPKLAISRLLIDSDDTERPINQNPNPNQAAGIAHTNIRINSKTHITSNANNDKSNYETNEIGDEAPQGEAPGSRSSEAARSRLSPVIMVPGDGGSRLEAKLNKKEALHHYCEKKTDNWFDLWLNLSLLVPFALECWVDNMRLVYNSTTRTTANPEGVDIRVGGFGTTESIEFVDPAKLYGTSYFQALVDQLVSLGYERNKNIKGAPYDFRKAPNELRTYFVQLKQLIEHTYLDNDREPVIIICHSMGCLNVLYFLQNQHQSWKDQHVRSLISLSGVWGGSVKAMKAFASGDNFGVIMIPSLSLRKDVRTFPSLAYLLPSIDVWPHDKPLMRNNGKVYTVRDYKSFFDDIDYKTGYDMWQDVHNLTRPLVAPGVEVHCLHGNKINTIEHLEYGKNEFPDGKPKISYADGDGTVNLVSLQACLKWKGLQEGPINYKNFHDIDHMTILSDKTVMDFIGEAIVKKFR